MSVRQLGAVLLVTAGASCAAVSPSATAPPVQGGEPTLSSAPSRREPVAHLEVFGEDVEIEEGEITPDADPTTVIVPFERKRNGFRGSFGNRSVKGYFQLFGEELVLVDGGGNTTIDSFGVGGGVVGKPNIVRFNENATLTLPYRFGLQVVAGDGEDDGVDAVVYAESELEIGVGADLLGIQPSVGFYAQNLRGAFDLVGADSDDDTDGEIEAMNRGTFVELYYKSPDFPIYVRARKYFSDVDGTLITFGAAF